MNLETRLRSSAARLLSSARFERALQRRARLQRRLRRRPPTVHYFHQVDDPYSHLAVQKLDALRAAYELTFVPHLVSAPEPAYRGSAEHFDGWALRDAASVAEAYATSFPDTAMAPAAEATESANALLAAHLEDDRFASVATEVGEALWSGKPIQTGTRSDGRRAVERGNALRRSLGHYQGAMFHFDGQWYWGVDRLRVLETRLIREGFAPPTSKLLVPEPTPATSNVAAEGVLLEYFPSLRSPYTAVGHPLVLDMIERTGVRVELRPVMPMLMRGIPAPSAKQRYIITDAAREGRARGNPLGRIVDPFGEPVKRAFALFPAAVRLQRGMQFVSAYLRAAWMEGIDITTGNGLRKVTDNAGIDWLDLQDARAGTDWEATLDDNLQAMLTAGLWGVPSFRVSGGNRQEPFACWGQDRIWRVEHEIVNRI